VADHAGVRLLDVRADDAMVLAARHDGLERQIGLPRPPLVFEV
jgi:hypothetical protein